MELLELSQNEFGPPPFHSPSQILLKSMVLKSVVLKVGLALAFLFLALITSTTASSTDPCIAEETACRDDAVCDDCLKGVSLDYDLWGECAADHIEENGHKGGCAAVSTAACCDDFVSPHDCLENGLFVAYELCELSGVIECTAFTCDGISGVSGGGSDDAEEVVDDDDVEDEDVEEVDSGADRNVNLRSILLSLVVAVGTMFL